MIAALVATLLLVGALVLAAAVVLDHLTRWPELASTRLRCSECDCTAVDDRWMALHRAAQHPETYTTEED